MITDPYTETCKDCCKKHLSDALVRLASGDASVVNDAYIRGHLSHAANHIVKISPAFANTLRDIRLKLDSNRPETVKDLENALVDLESVEPVGEKPETSVTAPVIVTKKKGCGCGR